MLDTNDSIADNSLNLNTGVGQIDLSGNYAYMDEFIYIIIGLIDAYDFF